jgi:hypothetical protein
VARNMMATETAAMWLTIFFHAGKWRLRSLKLAVVEALISAILAGFWVLVA